MIADSNKLRMKEFTQFINTANEHLAKELIAPDAAVHLAGRSEPLLGPSGYLTLIGLMRSGFPDIQWTLEEMIAENEKVAARFTMRGTHRGIFFDVPPTSKVIEVQSMNFYTWSNGQIIEEHRQSDLLGLLKQIGAKLR